MGATIMVAVGTVVGSMVAAGLGDGGRVAVSGRKVAVSGGTAVAVGDGVRVAEGVWVGAA